MKKLILKSPAYIYLEKSFAQWLDVLGYAPSTVYQLPVNVREFLHWMECQGHTKINNIDTPVIHKYYAELSQRKNHRRGGGLSNNYLNLHLIALDKMLDYLRQKGKLILPKLDIKREEEQAKPVIPLTQDQMIGLYEATYRLEPENPAYALRDRAMLAIFYDCGLRRNEGEKLDLKDINFDTRLVHVRHGKNSHQRFVPFSSQTAHYLEEYRHKGRIRLLRHHSPKEAFFISKRGSRLKGKDMARRLIDIQKYCTDPELKRLNLHLHLLRHSIATHLMQNGMPLENISRFLGHHSLASTQVYTHLANENVEAVQPFDLVKSRDQSHFVKLHD